MIHRSLRLLAVLAIVCRPTMRRRAFTLVELLVVVAIIALLISILLPALKRARAVAQTTVCLSAQRQVGLGLVFYGEDFNGHGLSSKDEISKFGQPTNTSPNSPWFVQLYPYVGGPDLTKHQNKPHQVVFYWLGWPDPDWDKLRRMSVFGCPEIETDWIARGFGGYTGYEMAYFFEAPKGTGYLGNGQLGASWAWGSPSMANHPKIDLWTSPSSHIWMLDGSRTAIGDSTWANEGGYHTCVWPNKKDDAEDHGWFNGSSLNVSTGRPEPRQNGGTGSGGDPERHVGKANYLFMDGHASTLSAEPAWYGIVAAQ